MKDVISEKMKIKSMKETTKNSGSIISEGVKK